MDVYNKSLSKSNLCLTDKKEKNIFCVSKYVFPVFQSPVTALTWGHNDKRIFVATGPQVIMITQH